MCCPIIPCREEIMRRAEDLTKCQNAKKEQKEA
jgi:hypothetical protein